eukprot:scaffold2408_cov279-Chaetoceros_neogracile.AAC.36
MEIYQVAMDTEGVRDIGNRVDAFEEREDGQMSIVAIRFRQACKDALQKPRSYKEGNSAKNAYLILSTSVRI